MPDFLPAEMPPLLPAPLPAPLKTGGIYSCATPRICLGNKNDSETIFGQIYEAIDIDMIVDVVVHAKITTIHGLRSQAASDFDLNAKLETVSPGAVASNF